MIRFEDLALFVRTAACGSFSKAARDANLLPGQGSAAIQRLERDLDIRLFARSTRSLRLTDEGERYRPYARDVIDLLHAGRDELRRGRSLDGHAVHCRAVGPGPQHRAAMAGRVPPRPPPPGSAPAAVGPGDGRVPRP